MPAEKSGKYWVKWANTNAKKSNKLEELESSFRKNVKEFITALTDAGAKVDIDTTKRSEKRAYLFHWSWKISLGKFKPSDAKKMIGVDIEWDHGDDKKSKSGAKEMVDGFGLAVPPKSIYPPSTDSNHIKGKAIDMAIMWKGTIKVKKKDKTEASLTYKENVKTNFELHKVGASYGVKKLLSDAPHWSFNGK